MSTDSENVKQFFDQTDNYLHKRFGIQIRSELIKSMLGNRVYKNVLDVGCGDGKISLPIFTNKTQLTLLDLSDKMLELATANVPQEMKGHVNTYCGSLDSFAPDKKYDLILAIGLLAHTPSVEEALEKMKSLLNDDGRLIVQFSDYQHLITKIALSTSKGYSYKLQKIRRSDLRNLCRKTGFKIERAVKFANIIPGMGRLPDKMLYSFVKMSV